MQLAFENTVLPPQTEHPCDLRILVSLKGSAQPLLGHEPLIHIEVDLQGSPPILEAVFWQGSHHSAIHVREVITSKNFPIICPEFTIYIEPVAFFDQPEITWPKAPTEKGDVFSLSPMGWIGDCWYDGAFAHWRDGELLSYFPAGYFKRLGVSLEKKTRQGISVAGFTDLYTNPIPTLRQSLLRSIALRYLGLKKLVLCPKSLKRESVLAMVLATMSFVDLPRSAFLDPSLDKETRSKLKKLLLNMGYRLLDRPPLTSEVLDLTWIACSLLRPQWLPGLFAEIHRPTGLLHAFTLNESENQPKISDAGDCPIQQENPFVR